MNYEHAQRVLETRLRDNWVDTPITWKNMEPRDYGSPSQPLLPVGEENYVLLSSEIVGNNNITVDRRCSRGQGQLIISVFVKAGTGIRVAKTYLDKIIDLFDSVTLTDTEGDVRVGPLIGSAGYSVTNGWYVEEAGFMFYFERYRI